MCRHHAEVLSMEVSQSADWLLAPLRQDIRWQIPLLVPSPMLTAGDQHHGDGEVGMSSRGDLAWGVGLDLCLPLALGQTHNPLLREQRSRWGLNTFWFAFLVREDSRVHSRDGLGNNQL